MRKLSGARNGAAPLAILLAVVSYGVGIFDHDLWLPDEYREAEIAREIGEFRSPFIPTLVGEPFVEKPPFYLWCIKACFFFLGGPSAGAARIPSVLFALGAGLFACLLARRTIPDSSGGAAFFLTCFSLAWLDTGHRVQADAALAFAVSGALWALQVACYPASERDEAFGWYGFYGFCALAFWCKGLIGVVFPMLACCAVLLCESRFREFIRPRHWLGMLVIVASASLWLLALWWGDPSGTLVNEVVIKNHLGRFLPGEDYHLGHQHDSVFFYFRALLYFLPGLAFLIPSIRQMWREHAPRSQWLVPACAVVLGFIFLTAAGTKRSVYFLPLYAPLAVLSSPWLVRALRDANTGSRWVFKLSALVYGTAIIGAPFVRLLLPWLAPLVPRQDPFLFLERVDLPKTIYLPALLLLLLGSICVGVCIALMRSQRPHRMTSALVLLLVVSYPCVFGSWVGVNNRLRSFRPFADAIDKSVPRTAPLFECFPQESTCGIIPFYAGRYPRRVGNIRALLAEIAGEENPYVLVSMRRQTGVAPWQEGDTLTLSEIARVSGDPLTLENPLGSSPEWRGKLLYFHHNGTRRWHFLFRMIR